MPLDGDTFKGPDFRPSKAKKDKGLMSSMHKKGLRCEITGKTPASLHHVYPRGQGGDDVPENLVALEGSGTTGMHGKIENQDPEARRLLGEHLMNERPDVIFYVKDKLGETQGAEWLKNRLFVM